MERVSDRAFLAVPREGEHGHRLIAAAVLGMESLFFLMLLGGSSPLAAAAIPLGALYFFLAIRSPELAWALVFVAAPFSIDCSLPPGGAMAVPTEPMIVLALGAWFLRGLRFGMARPPASPLHLALAVLAAISLLSIVLGGFRAVGLKAWLVSAGYASFGYLYFTCSPCDSNRRERWVWLASAVGAFWGLYGAVRVAVLGVGLRAAYGASRPFFIEHGTYSAFVAMVLPLALFEALERRGRARLLFGACALAMFLGIAFSFTRAAWLSLVVVLPIALAFWAHSRRAWRRLAATAALVTVACAAIAAAGIGDRLVRHAGTVVEVENVSNLERLNRWAAAMEMAWDHPWLGVGYGAYADAYPAYRRKTIVTEQSLVRMGVHSEPLRLLAETGVFGLLAGVWLMVLAGRVGLRVFRCSDDPAVGRLSLALVAGLATYAVHGLFNSYLGMDKISVPFWVGLGAIGGLGAVRQRNSTTLRQ